MALALKVVADERVAALDSTFARHGDLVALGGREIARKHLADADALITRTVTRVDRQLLEGTAVRFVGTATIGTDHIDTAWLDGAGIRWAAAPGCNADATAQFTLAIYLLACRRLGLDPLAQRFGIVGCGNVGGRLRRLLESLGVDVIANDPPLEAQGGAGFRPFEEILACDVISLHVPLTRSGRWPTRRMFDRDVLAALSTDTLLLNASRGDVMDGAALEEWMARGGRAALDVWPGEPHIETGLLEKVAVGTPHIAGYSLDGKYRASATIYRAFCDCFGLEPGPAPEPPAHPAPPDLDIRNPSFMDQLLEACPVERDDAAMRTLLDVPSAERAAAFDALRSAYPLRRDLAL